MTRDNHDLLIDQLLRETLGGDRPRDMTARVMAHVRIMDRFRFRSWIATGSAIAAGQGVLLPSPVVIAATAILAADWVRVAAIGLPLAVLAHTLSPNMRCSSAEVRSTVTGLSA